MPGKLTAGQTERDFIPEGPSDRKDIYFFRTVNPGAGGRLGQRRVWRRTAIG